MNSVPMRLESALNIIRFAEEEGITVADAAERLVATGKSRLVAQRKWRTKMRRSRRT